jgi:Cell wall-associated hydrolases (invasion-associated proteins)
MLRYSYIRNGNEAHTVNTGGRQRFAHAARAAAKSPFRRQRPAMRHPFFAGEKTMNRLPINRTIAAVAVAMAVTAGCTPLFNGAPFPQADQQTISDQAVCPDATDTATPIADLRIIPQDVKSFAGKFQQTIDADTQHRLAQRFGQQYFAPWTMAEPLFNVHATTEKITQLAAGTWYGESRLPVEPARMQSLLDLADWEHFPSVNQPGTMIKPAFIRILPTNRPFYETPDDVPFDRLQFAEAKPNEPVRILHTSKDGAWLHIETSYANGWVDSDAVRLADPSIRNRMINAKQIVVIRDFAELRTPKGTVLPQPKIGTLYPLVREEQDHWVINTASAGDDQHAVLVTARISKNEARRHPMVLDAEAATRIGNELLKVPYGWGDLYRNRDCSATTRDFFLAFGIWLPRNSHRQINSGPFVPLAGLPAATKENRIRDEALPFRTILHHQGHIMLYVGMHDNKPVVLHTVWALRYTPAGCAEKKTVIGRTILSTLEAGKELPLTKGTLLDRLDGMLLLPVVDWPQNNSNQD